MKNTFFVIMEVKTKTKKTESRFEFKTYDEAVKVHDRMVKAFRKSGLILSYSVIAA